MQRLHPVSPIASRRRRGTSLRQSSHACHNQSRVRAPPCVQDYADRPSRASLKRTDGAVPAVLHTVAAHCDGSSLWSPELEPLPRASRSRSQTRKRSRWGSNLQQRLRPRWALPVSRTLSPTRSWRRRFSLRPQGSTWPLTVRPLACHHKLPARGLRPGQPTAPGTRPQSETCWCGPAEDSTPQLRPRLPRRRDTCARSPEHGDHIGRRRGGSSG